MKVASRQAGSAGRGPSATAADDGSDASGPGHIPRSGAALFREERLYQTHLGPATPHHALSATSTTGHEAPEPPQHPVFPPPKYRSFLTKTGLFPPLDRPPAPAFSRRKDDGSPRLISTNIN
ncbi:hypothetical protein GCM10010357_14250 [Streptomyces luteireticuli]|uniref:Uncharacterized protein n=1 Tax=Streptomyces luteireticuli TaxID=173858 RepID=A0ABP3I8X7_9ACTN